MDGEARRRKIIDIIKQADKPISGSELAGLLGVSRQIVVGDIALLRASSTEIISTSKGYIINDRLNDSKPSIVVKARHSGEDIFDELCTILDVGGRIKDIFIEHPVYGRISVPINISNRMDARSFAEGFSDGGKGHLSDLTDGVHFHTIEADDQIAIIRIQKALNDKKYLLK